MKSAFALVNSPQKIDFEWFCKNRDNVSYLREADDRYRGIL